MSTDNRQALARMLDEALRLEACGDPVLAIEMSRVVAVLHETRQLIDPDYMALIAGRTEADGFGR